MVRRNITDVFVILTPLEVYQHHLLHRCIHSNLIGTFGCMLDFYQPCSIHLVSSRSSNKSTTHVWYSSLCLSTYSCFHIYSYCYIIIIVGVITRAVSVTTDAVVLGITLWKTFYIFQIDREARSTTKLTTALAYNGNTQLLCNVLLLMKHFTR